MTSLFSGYLQKSSNNKNRNHVGFSLTVKLKQNHFSLPRFTKFVRPACLWTQTYINHTKAIATGWGLVEFQSDKSDELLKVPLNMYSNKECNQAYEKSRQIPNGIIDSQLCAGNRGGHQDTCQGDSGGPLQVVNPVNNCLFYVIGLTSFGKSCGLSNNPGVYTRISAYLDWIEEVAWNK